MSKNAHAKQKAAHGVRRTNESAVIAVMAFVLSVSFLSVERFVGSGNEAHGQWMYESLPMPSTYRSPVPSSYVQPARSSRITSAAAKRAERRNARSGVQLRPSCKDASCTNLLDDFATGSPVCMKTKECVKALNIAVASKYCSNNRACTLLKSLKDFYETSPDCVYASSPICEYDIRRIILLTR